MPLSRLQAEVRNKAVYKTLLFSSYLFTSRVIKQVSNKKYNLKDFN
jgi:hypothetical protein